MLPLFVVVVRSLANGWQSHAGDVSLIELRTRDVGTTHTPLLGSYGRYGFNHPGPLWFGVLALPYRITGNLEVGVVLVGLASLAAVVWVAVRRGGLWWAALLTAILVWGAGPAYVSNPWEPEGLLLPSVALVLLAFDAAAGSDWSLPLVVGFASLLGAAQATLLPFAVAMVVVAAVRVRSKGPLLVAGAVLVVSWLPTVIQQLFVDPPNLTAMWNARATTGAGARVAGCLGHRGGRARAQRAVAGVRHRARRPQPDRRPPRGAARPAGPRRARRGVVLEAAHPRRRSGRRDRRRDHRDESAARPGLRLDPGLAARDRVRVLARRRLGRRRPDTEADPRGRIRARSSRSRCGTWQRSIARRTTWEQAIRSLAKQIDVPDDPVLVSSDASW